MKLDKPAVYFIATKHADYAEEGVFPEGSVVLDPWGYIPRNYPGVKVIRIGRRPRPK